MPRRTTLENLQLRFHKHPRLLDGRRRPLARAGRRDALAPFDTARRPRGSGAVRVHAHVGQDAPFTHVHGHDGAGGLETRGPAADLGDVLGLGEGVVGVVVEGVFVDVDAEGSLAVGVAEGFGDVDEFRGAFEGVVRADDEGGVGDDGFHGGVGVDGPLLAGCEVVVAGSGWFVDHFDADDNVGVFLGAVFLSHGDENVG